MGFTPGESGRRITCPGLDLGSGQPVDSGMKTPEEDPAFRENLIRASRQGIHDVQWVDRDETKRQNAPGQPEVVRLKMVAGERRASRSKVLRRAAHVPVEKLAMPVPAARL